MLMLEKESESGVIDLPEDEPEIIKLLIQYLYEAEYSPILPTGGRDTSAAAPPREPSYHYDFPHSCRGGSDHPMFGRPILCMKINVCPHHTCADDDAWSICCQNFSCERCEAPSPAPPPPLHLLPVKPKISYSTQRCMRPATNTRS